MSTSGELERLASDLSFRTLQQQEALLDELRARTGILLAATTLAASFLGARALEGGAHQWLGIAGVLAAVSSIVLSVYVLAPKSNLTFTLHGAAVYEYFVEAAADLVEAHRTLAYWNRETWDTNQSVIDRLIWCFGIACGALVAAVALWSLSLTLD